MLEGRYVREPVAAGSFYPDTPERLRRLLEAMRSRLPEVGKRAGKRVIGVIAPHAGYVYSGVTAMRALAEAAANDGEGVRNCFLLAPSHTVAFRGVALSEFGAFRTPLGDVPVREWRPEGSGEDAVWKRVLFVDNRAHWREHAIEVLLPMVQSFFPKGAIIPAVVGELRSEDLGALGVGFAQEDRVENLFLISSDFTHYGERFDYVPFRDAVAENLRQLDGGAIEKILAMDAEGFAEYCRKTGATICGVYPITLFLSLLKCWAAQSGDPERFSAELLSYTSSGELTGDWTGVVDYAAIAFYEKTTTE